MKENTPETPCSCNCHYIFDVCCTICNKEQPVNEEKRIYVIVAETVDTPNGIIVQPCGRIAAQCAHVVSKMRVRQALDGNGGSEPITTIVLAASNLIEMLRLSVRLASKVTFHDTNEEAYGPGRFLTAICTYPIEPSLLGDVLSHLPLWSHDKDTNESLCGVGWSHENLPE